MIAWECQSSWRPFPNANLWLHRDTCFYALCIPLPPVVAWAHLFPHMPFPSCQGALWHNIHVVFQGHYVEAWECLLSSLLRTKTAKWKSWNVCSCTCHVLVSPLVACACLFEYLPCPIIMLWHGHTCLHLNHHYVVALAHLFAEKSCPKTATWHCMHTCSQLCHVPALPKEGYVFACLPHTSANPW